MRKSLLVVAVVAVALVGCKRGVSSEACVNYFAKTEACAAKTTNKIKADTLRQSAAVSKTNFEKNSNPLAVEQSCKLMAEALNNDPDCK